MYSGKPVNILSKRSSGVLLPIFSLPGPHGIGDIGPASFRFIDFLQQSKQSCWQILPLGPTNEIFGNSPYMSPSAFAGNPLLISPEILVEQGLLTRSDIEVTTFSEYQVDYRAVVRSKIKLLQQAYHRFLKQCDHGLLEDFSTLHQWLNDYSLFLALKDKYKQLPWYQWPKDIRRREPEAIQSATAELQEEIRFFTFVQYLFFNQWEKLRSYARNKAIQIIGDLPIYVALDSVDAWSHQGIFQLHKKTLKPTQVAGVPPDYFSTTGQLWGNPLYRWNSKDQQVKNKLWDWWENRLRVNFLMTDIIRIDHFRGFESFWSVPAKEKTAINGKWTRGPGKPFFEEMNRRLGKMAIIAEDLGVITPAVEKLRDELGYPGMKILLFAFDGSPENAYLPYNCPKNSVIYTGTHDNDTAVGWFLSPEVLTENKVQAKRFANSKNIEAGTFHQDLAHLAMSSPANLTILPMQDILGFGNDCRLNTPGTTENNWQWRCAPRFINQKTTSWLKQLTELFGRDFPPNIPVEK